MSHEELASHSAAVLGEPTCCVLIVQGSSEQRGPRRGKGHSGGPRSCATERGLKCSATQQSANYCSEHVGMFRLPDTPPDTDPGLARVNIDSNVAHRQLHALLWRRPVSSKAAPLTPFCDRGRTGTSRFRSPVHWPGEARTLGSAVPAEEVCDFDARFLPLGGELR